MNTRACSLLRAQAASVNHEYAGSLSAVHLNADLFFFVPFFSFFPLHTLFLFKQSFVPLVDQPI